MTLLEHVLRFCRALHDHGIPVGTAAAMDLCRGLDCIDIRRRADVHAATRALLVTQQEQLEVHDRVFRAFWDGIADDNGAARPPAGDSAADPGDKTGSDGTDRKAQPRDRAGNPDTGEQDPDALPEYCESSLMEVVKYKDFRVMSRAELEHARRAIVALTRQFASYRGRRLVSGNNGARLDFRRMCRRSIPYGLLPFKLAYLQKKRKRARLVLLCDVSGSMEQYSSFLIQFICGLRLELRRVEIGIFATQLKLISQKLDRRRIARAISQLSREDTGWGGGTNIGASLQSFSESLPGRNMHHRSVVVILSDGWDRGDVNLLREQMQRLRQSAHKLIWLNPLLGRERYEPLCQGIRTALPYLDYFLPAHNLASLEHVARVIRASMR